jgi:hypothetical protein
MKGLTSMFHDILTALKSFPGMTYIFALDMSQVTNFPNYWLKWTNCEKEQS